MNFPGNFRHIGTVDVDGLRRKVEELSPEQWGAFALRQKRYEVHRDTETIGLVFDPDFRHSHPTKLPALEMFAGHLVPALEMAAAHYEQNPPGDSLVEQFGLGYFVRATLVRLKAGGEIAPHQDNNFSLVHSHRLHLPVITNDKVTFSVGKEMQHLPAGALVEINNRRMHAVRNDGDEDRVHVILDFVLPGEKCCCGARLHPDTVCSPQACRATDHLQVPCECYPER